jgi:hypothetical protein
MKCEKCAGSIVSIEDGQLVCIAGHRYFPRTVQKSLQNIHQIIHPDQDGENTTSQVEKQEIGEGNMAVRKCVNCGRVKKIIGHGFCSGCYWAVRGMEEGGPEYVQALASAKTRFSDPDYKSHGGGKKQKAPAPIKRNPILKPKTPQPSSDDPIVTQLIYARNLLQDKIFKINQAIELLS